jgi:hypothetical protein
MAPFTKGVVTVRVPFPSFTYQRQFDENWPTADWTVLRPSTFAGTWNSMIEIEACRRFFNWPGPDYWRTAMRE